MPIISFENVSFRYPKSSELALNGISLEIPEGSFFALLGPNGAGKTTLLRLLCGRFETFDGRLIVDSRYRSASGFLDPKHYGVLLENPGIYAKLSVLEYLQYFGGFYGMDSAAVADHAKKLSEELLLGDLQQKMSALSLGNRQKVQLMRAMLPHPEILILDEPVANLDPNAREMVWKLIAKWRRETGGTAIVSSHILAEMEAEATHYGIIDYGVVKATGAVQTSGVAVLTDGAVSVGDKVSDVFSLKLENGATAAQIEKALTAAHIAIKDIEQCQGSLSDIYRDATGT